MKSLKLLQEFNHYCLEHPDLRFWQSLRNWSDCNFIYKSDELVEDSRLKDTFYEE